MAGMSPIARRAMMRVAKNLVAPAMRRIARIRTKRGAAAVKVVDEGDHIEVRAGDPTGEWGWTPIVVSMFENNRRHLTFGHHTWRNQGHLPITDMTIKLVMRQAEDEFTKDCVQAILGKYNL